MSRKYVGKRTKREIQNWKERKDLLKLAHCLGQSTQEENNCNMPLTEASELVTVFSCSTHSTCQHGTDQSPACGCATADHLARTLLIDAWYPWRTVRNVPCTVWTGVGGTACHTTQLSHHGSKQGSQGFYYSEIGPSQCYRSFSFLPHMLHPFAFGCACATVGDGTNVFSFWDDLSQHWSISRDKHSQTWSWTN